jgi:hypothetical protein
MESIENPVSVQQKIIAEDVGVEPASTRVQEAIEEGPYGALVLAGLAVCLLFIGWLLFYFVLFMRRGYVG